MNAIPELPAPSTRASFPRRWQGRGCSGFPQLRLRGTSGAAAPAGLAGGGQKKGKGQAALRGRLAASA